MDQSPERHTHSHDWLAPAMRPVQLEGVFDHRQATELATRSMAPMKAAALSQMELMTLASRRAQAVFAIPSRLARCKTHDDLVEEQMRFWQEAFDQCQDTASQVMRAWSFALPWLPAPVSFEPPSPLPFAGLIQLPPLPRSNRRPDASHPAAALARGSKTAA